MSGNSRLLEENAALVALLNATDRRKESWSAIAEKITRQGSAIEVFNHEADPAHFALKDEGEGQYESGVLFGDDEVPVNAERRHRLEEARDEAKQLVAEWDRHGLDFVSVLDERYPPRLHQVEDTPPFVFCRGRFNERDRQDLGVCVLGSQNASQDALLFARAVTGMLVERGLTVFAGLTVGVDAEVHRQAMDLGGRAVAFLGTGIDRCYPLTNRLLQERIGREGQLLSQFWPETGPSRHTFPARSATMCGYAVATVIVEATEQSDARMQARLAQRQGKPVLLRDEVARHTVWGASMVGRKGVYVVSSVADVSQVLDQVLAGLRAQ